MPQVTRGVPHLRTPLALGITWANQLLVRLLADWQCPKRCLCPAWAHPQGGLCPHLPPSSCSYTITAEGVRGTPGVCVQLTAGSRISWSGELPLLPGKLARPVCGNPLWAHEDSSAGQASPVLQWLGPRPWPCWGQGVHPAGTPAQTCLPHHGRRFCLQHGPSAQPGHNHPSKPRGPTFTEDTQASVLEGLRVTTTPLPTSARQPAQRLRRSECTPGEGTRRPGPSAALPLLGLPHPKATLSLLCCRGAGRAPAPTRPPLRVAGLGHHTGAVRFSRDRTIHFQLSHHVFKVACDPKRPRASVKYESCFQGWSFTEEPFCQVLVGLTTGNKKCL